MNLLIENGTIEEIGCGPNFAYVLKDSADFLSTEYKVLQSQAGGSFIRCMKLLYNGKVGLYYLVDQHVPFSDMLPSLDPDRFTAAVRSLLGGILEVCDNGFLSPHGIDSSFDHIYVDPQTLKAALVYLPLKKHAYNSPSAFESALRAGLVRAISENPTLASSKTEQLAADLRDGTLSLEALYAKLGGKNAPPRGGGGSGEMKLVSLDAPASVEIAITKPEFFIGKKESNDGVIRFNKMVSRFHCKVTQAGRSYTICDLQSANGTFVNGVRLIPDQPVPIKGGDVVRLANSSFQVVIG